MLAEKFRQVYYNYGEEGYIDFMVILGLSRKSCLDYIGIDLIYKMVLSELVGDIKHNYFALKVSVGKAKIDRKYKGFLDYEQFVDKHNEVFLSFCVLHFVLKYYSNFSGVSVDEVFYKFIKKKGMSKINFEWLLDDYLNKRIKNVDDFNINKIMKNMDTAYYKRILYSEEGGDKLLYTVHKKNLIDFGEYESENEKRMNVYYINKLHNNICSLVEKGIIPYTKFYQKGSIVSNLIQRTINMIKDKRYEKVSVLGLSKLSAKIGISMINLFTDEV